MTFTTKDFDPIRADYAFFEEHSTENAADEQTYLPHVRQIMQAAGPIRMLDFGSGPGGFTSHLLTAAGIPKERLRLTLVEPVEAYRRQALTALQGFSDQPVQVHAALPGNLAGTFDLALSNHVLYYVPDLDAQVPAILRALAPNGLFVCALAGRDNVLVQLWMRCFEMIGKPLPYHTAEDLERVLTSHAVSYRKQPVHYDLVFPDMEENRLKIMRFLMSNYFPEVPRQPMLDLFAPYAHDGRIVIRTGHLSFRIQPFEHHDS